MDRIPTLDGLKHILGTAIGVDGAIGGCVQVVDDDAKSLRIVEARGLDPRYFARFRVVPAGTASSCMQAYTERRRVVIRDVAADPAFAPFKEYAIAAGYRAVQSTPLIDRERGLRGVLSTYYATAHHPTTDSLEGIDRCCYAATLLLECVEFCSAVIQRDRRLGLPARALSPAGSQAADAARRLLSTSGAEHRPIALDTVIKNLEVVAAELAGRLQRSTLHSAATA